MLAYLAFGGAGDDEPGALITGNRVAFSEHSSLVFHSSRIVVATYLDSSTREVRVVSPARVAGKRDVRTEVIHRFEVDETLKGAISPGETQEVVSLSALRLAGHTDTFEVLSPIAGQEYVLFLSFGFDLYEDRVRWSFSGEPGMAIAGDDGMLAFLLTGGLEEKLRLAGRLGPDGKPTPFTATLDEIRAEVTRQTPQRFAEWMDFYRATDQVSGSSSIVTATYFDSGSRDIRSFSTGTGLYTGDAQTIGFQRFEVVQTLKGRTTPGDVLKVVSGGVSYDMARYRMPAQEWAYEALSPVEGQEYVLFLDEFPFPPHFDAVWGFAGEPRMATVSEDGALQFVLTTRFVEQFREAGLLVSSGGEPAPFAATLNGVKAEIARQAAAPGSR